MAVRTRRSANGCSSANTPPRTKCDRSCRNLDAPTGRRRLPTRFTATWSANRKDDLMTDVVGNLHPEFRSFWHPVAWAHEVVGPMAVVLLGEPLVLVRDQADEVVAFIDECPHRGAPLSLGRVEGSELVCAYHGWRFGFDGAATCIPALAAGAPIPA